jgi:threonyl-tRNA synthetase
LDFQLPQRFEAEYTGEDGEKHRPIMIHRVVFGSIERFIGILIEHYAGKFPVWLAPVQVKVLNLTERTEEYAKALTEEMNEKDLRAEADLRNEKIGYKIREALLEKVPYIVVLGDKEAEAGQVSVRKRGEEKSVVMSKDEFIALVQKDNADKVTF